MSIPKFIVVHEGITNRTIALDNIASVYPERRYTRIVLKEVKDGKNVEFACSNSYQWVQDSLTRLTNS